MLRVRLFFARLVTLGQYTPGTDRVLPRRGPAFAAAVRVSMGSSPRPAPWAGCRASEHGRLADRFKAVLLVADFPDGGAAVEVDLADLARRRRTCA